MASITFHHVFKRYAKDKTSAVEDFHLDVQDAEFLVLVGPSGCGKSTSLRMLAGLEDISEGEIRIGGQVVNDMPPKDRNIAMVFQNYALYPNMTVFENIAFGLRLRNLPKHEIELAVKQASRTLELENYLERKPRELSGGQRQRVALGRAIVRRPDVFLMDEPLSNLDAKLRVHMRTEIINLHRRFGVTTIYVTHDQVEAMTMGDRIVVMNRGIIQQVDTPENVYDKPANLFVAGFIGSPPMNVIEGKVQESKEGLAFHTRRFMLRIAVPQARALREARLVDRKVLLGLRPEHLVFHAEQGEAEAGSSLAGELLHDEFVGSDRFFHLQVDEKQRLIIRAQPRLRLQPGQQARAAADMERALFYHADSGQLVAGP